MDIKDFFNAILLVSIFVFYALYVISIICSQLKEDRTPINRTLIGINCLICLYLCVSSTFQIEPGSHIDMTGFSWSGLLGTIVAIFFMGAVPAGALAVISSNVAMIISKNHSRRDMPPGFQGAMISGLHAMYVAISYGVLLYKLGLNGKFFPFTLLP